MPNVRFKYMTSVRHARFQNARLVGSWDDEGRRSNQWSARRMRPETGDDGCPAFSCVVELADDQVGVEFDWGVILEAANAPAEWGIATELPFAADTRRHRSFALQPDTREVTYRLSQGRWLGARKVFSQDGAAPGLRFNVWTPNAQAVSVVFSTPDRGYIGDDGSGIDPARAPIQLTQLPDGIWTSGVLPDFASYQSLPYMYRIINEQGRIRYRTDLFSRAQVGAGSIVPEREAWNGDPALLDGSKSCSVVHALDDVACELCEGAPRMSREAFWASEFTANRRLPQRLEDLVIYELHLGSLAADSDAPGTLYDGIAFLDHLSELGVNAVELMPLSEFSGAYGWGYGDTHHMVIESSAGSLDDYRHFVRECHRRGIAVIQDVCYNHYDQDAERAQWQYDSELPEHNIYYWYQGNSQQYSSPDGGYIDNGSSGYAPRYSEEIVRQQFIASAAHLMDECHVDGFRVDLTQAFHRDNSLHADRSSVPEANLFGQKLLHEWSRTLRLLNANVILIAEDHTGWDKVTQSPDLGGLGFDARWDADFYHHLIGDADASNGHARLLHNAAFGGDFPLDLNSFAASLYDTRNARVVYHESHDEAGNSPGSARTLPAAVNGAPLVDGTRQYAEARARLMFGLSLFSAGTPMFFMGEETGATQPFRFGDYVTNRETILQKRTGFGANLFRFYREAIALEQRYPAARSRDIDIIHVNPDSRVIAFVRRSNGDEDLLVIASLHDTPYSAGYVIWSDPQRLPDGGWREVFNSDAAQYGGFGAGNAGASILAYGGRFEALLPASGFVVFARA
jgi:1,4-alpha-glucan branching enzyme